MTQAANGRNNLFGCMVPEGESIMVGRHEGRWLEKEAEKSYLQPQTHSREKIEVEMG